MEGKREGKRVEDDGGTRKKREDIERERKRGGK